jgi:hypothetical protein
MKQSEKIKTLEERVEALEAPQREGEEREREEAERIQAEKVEAKRRVAQFRKEQERQAKLEEEARQELSRRASEGLQANGRGPAESMPEVSITEEMVAARDARLEPQPPIEAEVTAEALAARDVGRS